MLSPARAMAAGVTALSAVCLLLAMVAVGRLPATRQAKLQLHGPVDLGYQYVDPQAQLGVETHAVKLPEAGSMGSNAAFLGFADGEGTSVRDLSRRQQLAVNHARQAQRRFKDVYFGMVKVPPLKAQLRGRQRAPKQLWPASPIGQVGAGQASARPVMQSDAPVGPMGTNGVFLGSHQGGDSSFSSPHGAQPLPRRKSTAPMLHKRARAPHALVKRAPEQPAAKPSGTRAQKLLVGSFNVKPRLQTKPQQPQGVGNQAAPHFGDAHGFFNHMSRP